MISIILHFDIWGAHTKMTKAKQLSERQLAVTEDIFDGELKEQEILTKHKLSRRLYDKWLADESFRAYCERRMIWERRRCELTLARSARSAASRLMALTGSQTPETARKACLDIISMQPADQRADAEAPSDGPELPPETAGKLLAALAEGQDDDYARKVAQG